MTWERPSLRNAGAHTAAGSIAGACAAVFTAPLDLAKTRLQGEYAPKGPQQRVYTGLLGTLRTTMIEEGVRGWYKGLGSCLLGLVPAWAVYFTCYDMAKTMLSRSPLFQQHVHTTHICAAAAAGCANQIATNPLWVVKVRLQTQPFTSNPNRYRGIAHAFAKIYRQEGVVGFFKGLPVALLGVSHVMIQFPLYEWLKRQWRLDQAKPTDVSLLQVLAASTLSKLVASSITYPHEVIRTRFQRQRKAQRYTSIPRAFAKVVHEEGIGALYRGMGTNLVRVVPACAITFTVYEYAIRLIQK